MQMSIILSFFIFVVCIGLGVFIYLKPIPIAERADSPLVKPLMINVVWIPGVGFFFGAVYCVFFGSGDFLSYMQGALNIVIGTIYTGWLCIFLVWRRTLFQNYTSRFFFSHLVIGLGYLVVTRGMVGF